MRSNRTAARLSRLLLAALFAFMSLAHGPVMAFAKPDRSAHHHDATLHARHPKPTAHQHHSVVHAQHQDAPAPQTDKVGICYAFGCFVAVAPIVIAALRADLVLLAMLAPALPPTILPAAPEPAVPPPRLQA